MYDSLEWQLLEERIDDDVDGAFDAGRTMQYVWPPETPPETRYIDDIIKRRQYDSGDPTGEPDDVWYHVTDAQFSTVAVLNDVATLVERVSYDAYGNARHHRMADLTGEGGVGGGDSGLLQSNWNDYGVGDLNRDGFVNAADLGMLNANWGGAEPSGAISTTDNIIGYAGYIFNAEVPGSDGRSGLYTVRHRHYSPDLGRWLSRDPLGYVDGMSLYAYVAGGALTFNDPFGLTSVGACSGINSDVNYVRRWIENRRHGLNDCSDELSTTSDVGINPFKYGVGRHGALFGSEGTLDYEAERKAGQCGRFC